MRTNYVLVDLENVQPSSLEKLAHDHFKVIVFVGAKQAKLSFDLVHTLQKLGAEYVKVSGSGRDALDFHIAYYVGQLAATEENAYFHIISKDTGFDPLIKHLHGRVSVSRVKSILEIPLLRAASTKATPERVEAVLLRLKQLKLAKPRTFAKLSSTIASMFRKQLAEEEVQALVQDLAKRGCIVISGNKVSYTLPGDS